MTSLKISSTLFTTLESSPTMLKLPESPMDVLKLQQSLFEEVTHAEHSIEGAVILGRGAVESLTRIRTLCEELFERLTAADESYADFYSSGDVQRATTRTRSVEVNGLDGTAKTINEVDSSTKQHSKVQTANNFHQAIRTGLTPIQAPEPMAIIQSLRETMSRLSVLIEETGTSKTKRSKQEHINLENAVRRQTMQTAAKDAVIASQGAEIAYMRRAIARKEAEIEQLGSSSNDRSEQERIALEDTIQHQTAVIATIEADIARKETEIEQRKSQRILEPEGPTSTHRGKWLLKQPALH